MNVTAAVAVLAALLSTIITAIANQAHWAPERKRLVSGVVALILGGLASIASNQVGDWVPASWSAAVGQWLIMAGGVAILAQGAFAQFKDTLTQLENATTIPVAVPSELAAETADELVDEVDEVEPEPEPECVE